MQPPIEIIFTLFSGLISSAVMANSSDTQAEYLGQPLLSGVNAEIARVERCLFWRQRRDARKQLADSDDQISNSRSVRREATAFAQRLTTTTGLNAEIARVRLSLNKSPNVRLAHSRRVRSELVRHGREGHRTALAPEAAAGARKAAGTTAPPLRRRGCGPGPRAGASLFPTERPQRLEPSSPSAPLPAILSATIPMRHPRSTSSPTTP